MKVTLLMRSTAAGAVWFHTVDLAKGSYVIGREDADAGISDPRCSRRHATVFHDPDKGVCVEDLGSTNGTFVNGHSVEWAVIAPGDELRLGGLVISLVSVNPTGLEPVDELA